LLVSILSGCTATKFLKEGESFYAGADIKIKLRKEKSVTKAEFKEELQTLDYT
jgi:hypothetical protein